MQGSSAIELVLAPVSYTDQNVSSLFISLLGIVIARTNGTVVGKFI